MSLDRIRGLKENAQRAIAAYLELDARIGDLDEQFGAHSMQDVGTARDILAQLEALRGEPSVAVEQAGRVQAEAEAEQASITAEAEAMIEAADAAYNEVWDILNEASDDDLQLESVLESVIQNVKDWIAIQEDDSAPEQLAARRVTFARAY